MRIIMALSTMPERELMEAPRVIGTASSMRFLAMGAGA